MGESCVKYLLQQRIFVSFAYFVVKNELSCAALMQILMRILSEKMTKK